MSHPLWSIQELRKVYPRERSLPLLGPRAEGLVALDCVSFDIRPGETVGLVGRSGAGKSTLALCLLGLSTPSGGEIFFEGDRLSEVLKTREKSFRQKCQIVFQDPVASLCPWLSVEALVREPLRIHSDLSRSGQKKRVRLLLDMVGLSSALCDRLPHQLSVGQCQRVGIARALASSPVFILADEPVASLDILAQAQILKLLKELKRELELTVLLISHNLPLIRNAADRVAVLSAGAIVEIDETEALFRSPKRAATRRLIQETPLTDPAQERKRLSSFVGRDGV